MFCSRAGSGSLSLGGNALERSPHLREPSQYDASGQVNGVWDPTCAGPWFITEHRKTQRRISRAPARSSSPVSRSPTATPSALSPAAKYPIQMLESEIRLYPACKTVPLSSLNRYSCTHDRAHHRLRPGGTLSAIWRCFVITKWCAEPGSEGVA